MDDLEFRQRALANPRDTSPAFLEAAKRAPERRRFLDELLRFEQGLETALRIPAPPGLWKKLRTPPRLPAAPAANDGLAIEAPARRRRFAWLAPAAACLFIAFGAVLDVWPAARADSRLEREIFAHIYRELSYLGMNDDVSLATVNLYMAAVGGRLLDSKEIARLKVEVADDCWVRANTVHLVLEGERGDVTVLVIRNSPVKREFPIDDARFTGLVTPTRGGNLVVLGEKQEPISRFRTLFANNLDWEY